MLADGQVWVILGKWRKFNFKVFNFSPDQSWNLSFLNNILIKRCRERQLVILRDLSEISHKYCLLARCERKTVVSNSEEDWIFTPFEKPNYLYIIMMNDGGDNNSKSRMIIHKQPDNHIHYRSNNDYVKYLKRLQYTKIRKWRPMGEFKLRCPKLPRRASNYSLNTTLAITCAIKKFFFFSCSVLRG